MSLAQDITYLKSVHPLSEAQQKKLDSVTRENYNLLSEITDEFTNFNVAREGDDAKVATELIATWVKAAKAALSDKPKTARKRKTTTKTQSSSTAKKTKKADDCKPTSKTNTQRIDEQLRIIKRFVGMQGKERKVKQLLNLKNTIDRYFHNGLIDAKSKHIKLIQQIEARLKNALKKLDDLEQIIKVNIEDKKLLCELINVAGGKQVYPSISLLNRYVSMQGKPISNLGDRVEKLLKSIERAIQNQKVREDDPFFAELMKVKKVLAKSTKGKSEILPVSPRGLAGLPSTLKMIQPTQKKSPDGIGLGSTQAEADALAEFIEKDKSLNGQLDEIKRKRPVIPREQLPIDSPISQPIGKQEGAISSLQIGLNQASEDHLQVLPIPSEYEPILGKPKGRFSVMMSGARGGGKTTFLLRFIRKYAAKGKRIAYVSNEEIRCVRDLTTGQDTWRAESSLLERIEQNGARHRNIDFFGMPPEQLHEYDLVIVDSVSHGDYTPEFLEHMMKMGPNTSFIFIFHQLKDGSGYKGATKFQHLVDVVWKLDKLEGLDREVMVEEKNRHAFMGENGLIGQGSYTFNLADHG